MHGWRTERLGERFEDVMDTKRRKFVGDDEGLESGLERKYMIEQ